MTIDCLEKQLSLISNKQTETTAFVKKEKKKKLTCMNGNNERIIY